MTIGALFAIFLFTAFLALGTTDLNLRTEVELIMLFPIMGILGQAARLGFGVYTSRPIPFLRNPNDVMFVVLGIVGVFIAQILTLKLTPTYAIVLSDFSGSFVGLIPYTKLFYMAIGGAEELFFRFGLQSYFEYELRNPWVAIGVVSGVFAAYHQFVFGYFSVLILASSFVLCSLYYVTGNINVTIAIHVLVNFIAG